MFCTNCQEEVEWAEAQDAQMGYDDFCWDCQEVIDGLNEAARTEYLIAQYELARL